MKERITVKVPGVNGVTRVEFKLRAVDINDAVRLINDSMYNPLALVGASDSVRYTIRVVSRIPVPVLGRILELRGVKARVELIKNANEYAITNEQNEVIRLHSSLYGKLVHELLAVAPGAHYEQAWRVVKALMPS